MTGNVLKNLMEQKKLTQVQLAKDLGVTRQSVARWLNDFPIDDRNLKALSKYFGVTEAILKYGDSMGTGVTALYQEDDIPAGFVEIPEYRVECGAGHRDAPTFEVATDSKRAIYRREWFEERHLNPEKCKRLKVHGDSMVPILFDGDSILCDCSVTHIVSGKIYAFCFGDEVRVKRLFTKLNGGLIVHSENPQERDEEISPDEMDLFYLVGRVVDRSGSGPF